MEAPWRAPLLAALVLACAALLLVVVEWRRAECGCCPQLERRVALLEQRLEQRLEKGSQRQRRSPDKVEDNDVGPYVDFFDPKIRGELQAKGDLPPDGDSWVWLTTFSRVPYRVVQGFCKATQEYCPPGATGPQGIAGPRGPIGDRGPPGGVGGPGPVGPPGPKGDQGWPGLPGLDGRDGVPGEPGLDGVPGRSGADGAPGAPGRHGTNGADGRNGTDGRPGIVGPLGPIGPIGPKGLTGPRGKSGRPGINGFPGQPGVSTWMVNETKQLLIPPSIAGKNGEIIIVQELENVRLRCSATGQPAPVIQWSSGYSMVGDNLGALRHGAWRASSIPGPTLEIPRVTRKHAGAYMCTANNGIPPQDNRTIHLEVHFPPLIRIKIQMIPARNGSSISLECEVEAFPEPLRYWEREDGRLIEDKDRNTQQDFVGNGIQYSSIMRLRLMRLSHNDFGKYNCIAKNELGLTKGVITVYEQDPHLGTPPPIELNFGKEHIYGIPAPDVTSLDEICPPKQECPTCPRCSDPAISLADLLDHLQIDPLGSSQIYRGLPSRVMDCVLYAIGKPVYHRFTDQMFGAWLKDSSISSDPSGEKVWVTREMDTKHLYEFSNKDEYKSDRPSKTYKLNRDYVGNGHVVYNGSFYYHSGGKRVARLDLSSGKVIKEIELPSAATPIATSTQPAMSPSSNAENHSPTALYSTGHTYMDFSIDDNGLWIIYSMENSNNTAVAKIDPDNLQPQYIWNISINHHKVGEMFITCGVLYAVDSATERTTKVRLALDLYHNKLLEVSLPFANPFRRTTALGYSHRNKELYSWDRGNQLTYPVRYHEIGYNVTTDSSLQIV